MSDDLNIEARVSAGFKWFLATVPTPQRATALQNLDDLDMGDSSLDVVALAYEDDSDHVLPRLDVSDQEARDLGLRHVTAWEKSWAETTGDEDDAIGDEYGQLTDAWRQRLEDYDGNGGPVSELFEAWAESKYGPLAPVEQYGYADLKAAYEAGKAA